VRQYLADISGHMMDMVRRVREIWSATIEEFLIRSDELRNLEDEVLAHLNANEGPLLTAACQAYAMAMVSTMPPNKKAVEETIKGGGKSRLPGLIRMGILEPAKEGPGYEIVVRVYGGAFKVNGGNREFSLKIAKGLSMGAERAAKTAYKNFQEEAEELKSRAVISVSELLARKSGPFYMSVSDGKNGERFLPGGVLLGDSDGRAIKIIQAIGHFQKIMNEIAEAGTFISVDSLNHDRLELAKRLPDDKFRQARILHAILRRGVAEAKGKEAKIEAPRIPMMLEGIGVSEDHPMLHELH